MTDMKYIFRGLVIFDYNPKTKQIDAPNKFEELPHTTKYLIANFNMCKFIPEDYVYMADFFTRAYAHATGAEDVDLTDIEVY